MSKIKLPLHSQRLTFQEIDHKYDYNIFEELTVSVAEYMSLKTLNSIEETKNYIDTLQKQNEDGSNLNLVLTAENDEFVGCIGICEINTATPRIYIWLKKLAQGKGYGKEAVTKIKEIIFSNLQVEYLNYPMDERNTASLELAKSLGGELCAEYDITSGNGKDLHIKEYRFMN